jgi:hypothetical protein
MSCPHCGYASDHHTLALGSPAPAGPQPGSVSICARCGQAAIFAWLPITRTLYLRKPTQAELDEIAVLFAAQSAKSALANNRKRKRKGK